jgi:leader peptidase (prepilin peptidase)/N-methyltransferase
MGEHSAIIRLTVAAVLGVVLVGARGAGPAVIGCAYVAAVTASLWLIDVRSRRLPNALVLPGFAFALVGLVWQALARGSPEVLLAPLLCGAAVGAAMLALASGGGLGMGDVKLATLLAVALTGAVAPESGLAAAVLAFLGGAFLAGGAAGFAQVIHASDGAREEVPFGPVLLAAWWTVVVLW